MARLVSNVNIATETFQGWINKTNELLIALSYEAVTCTNTAGGHTVSGNGIVNGMLQVSTVVVGTALRGGTLAASGNLNITSNTVISGPILDVTSNTTLTTNTLTIATTQTSISAANSTQNNYIIGNSAGIYISNLAVSGWTTVAGNTTLSNLVVNTAASLGNGSLVVNTTSVSFGSNVTGNVNFTGSQVNVYSNLFVNSSNVTINAASMLIDGGDITIASNTTFSGSLTANVVVVGSTSSVNYSNNNLGSNTTAAQEVWSYNLSNTNTVKIVAQVGVGGQFQSSEMLVLSNSSVAYMVTYATVALPNNANLGVWSVSTNATHALLAFQQTSATSNVRLTAQLL